MGRIEEISYSNKIRDKIIEIIESRAYADTTKKTYTPFSPVYPLLHFFEAEMHEYGKHLQGKVLDLTQELEDSKYEIETLRGQIVDRDIDQKDLQERVNDLNDSLHNSETELDKLKSERKQIIEQNASQSLQLTLIEQSLVKANTTIVDLEFDLTHLKEKYEDLLDRYTTAVADGHDLLKINEAKDETIERLENDLSEAVEIMGAIYDNVDKYHLDFAFHGGECYDRLKEYLGV